MHIMKTPFHAVAAATITLSTFGAPVIFGLLGMAMEQPAEVVVAHDLAYEASMVPVFVGEEGPEADDSDEPTADQNVAGEAGDAIAAGSGGKGRGEASGEPTATDGAAATAEPRMAGLSGRTGIRRAGLTEGGGAAGKVEKPKTKRKCMQKTNPMINKSGGGKWTIDRTLVSYYTAHLRKLNSLGWSGSHEGPDGKTDGMIIGGVDCGNDLHIAGIRSGDVVHTVNGKKVKNFTQALFVYQAVKNDPVIKVELTRKGKRKTMVYTLEG